MKIRKPTEGIYMSLRKIITGILAAVMITVFTGAATGCKARKTDLSGKVQILCTTFPQYDWTMNIIGENFNTTVLSLLIKNGIDMHSYQPSAADIIAIANCDLLIYTGGESEEWIRNALKQPECQNVKAVALMDLLSDKLKEENPEEDEFDEHVWLSVKNSIIFTKAITEELIKLDSQNEEYYRNHCDSYIKKLNELDEEYEMTLSSAPQNTIIVCDRFPFRYLAKDYNLNYYAAFPGCEAETEASFETIAFLAGKLDELKCKGIFKIDGSKDKICQTVISNSKQPLTNIQTLDSMQSATLRDSYKEKTYISTMRANLDELRNALY